MIGWALHINNYYLRSINYISSGSYFNYTSKSPSTALFNFNENNKTQLCPIVVVDRFSDPSKIKKSLKD